MKRLTKSSLLIFLIFTLLIWPMFSPIYRVIAIDEFFIFLTDISLPEEVTLFAGEVRSLDVEYAPADASVKDCDWSSSDPLIAEVDQDGVITAGSPGSAVITASAVDGSGVTAECSVTVIRKVSGVGITDPPLSLLVGGSVQLEADVTPEDASDQTVVWSSSDPLAASVDDSGMLTGIARGFAVITVTTADGGFTDDCIVEIIQPVTDIQLSRKNTGIALGRDILLEAVILPADANNTAVSWSSNNELVAVVSPDGSVHGTGSGIAVITAKTDDGGKTDVCIVTVGQGAEEITVEGSSEVASNNSIQMNAVVLPEEAVNKNVEWSVIPGTGTAFISGDGILTGENAGTVTVVAFATDGSGVSGSMLVNVLEITYTVVFNNWDGTVLDTQIIGSGGSAIAPEEPGRTGHTFIGWNKVFDSVTSDLTVTALFSINSYTIIFDTDGGNLIPAVIQVYGSPVTAPADPVKEGYTFMGWDIVIPGTMPAENLTVTALWAMDLCIVTFRDWNGEVLKTEEVIPGGAAEAPADPVREGYVFTGWSLPYDNISHDTDIFAVYAGNRITGNTLDIDYAKKLISGISEGTTVDQLFDRLVNDRSLLVIRDRYGEVISDDARILETGMSVMIIGQSSSQLTIVVKGDLTGDGMISALDLLQLKKYLLGQTDLEGAYLAASLVTGNEEPTVLDLLQIKKHLLGQISIE